MLDDGRQKQESSFSGSLFAQGKLFAKQGPTSELGWKTCSLQGTADHDLGDFGFSLTDPSPTWVLGSNRAPTEVNHLKTPHVVQNMN